MSIITTSFKQRVWHTDDSHPAYGREVDVLLDNVPAVGERWTWLAERSDIPELLRDYHALVHASYDEGLPNAVYGALSTGDAGITFQRL